MDIFEYAMQMEQDGAKFYRELAEKTANAGIKNILNMLVDAEIKHYDIFHEMHHNNDVENTDTEILSGVKNLFIKMKDEGETNIDGTEEGLYKQALDIEKKSVDFYIEKAKEIDDPVKKDILLKIADEERKHCAIVESIADFVSRPLQWLENAEWTHLDEY